MTDPAPQQVPSPPRLIALAVRFGLELAALYALGRWGFAYGGEGAGGWVWGLAAPALAACFWGLLAAPKAVLRAPLAVRFLVQATVFTAAAAALWMTGLPGLALGFAAAVVVHAGVLRAFPE